MREIPKQNRRSSISEMQSRIVVPRLSTTLPLSPSPSSPFLIRSLTVTPRTNKLRSISAIQTHLRRRLSTPSCFNSSSCNLEYFSFVHSPHQSPETIRKQMEITRLSKSSLESSSPESSPPKTSSPKSLSPKSLPPKFSPPETEARKWFFDTPLVSKPRVRKTRKSKSGLTSERCHSMDGDDCDPSSGLNHSSSTNNSTNSTNTTCYSSESDRDHPVARENVGASSSLGSERLEQNGRSTCQRNLTKEFTFKPAMNQNSMKIAARTMRKIMPLEKRLLERKKVDEQAALISDCTFCPKINAHSIKLAQDRASRMHQVYF